MKHLFLLSLMALLGLLLAACGTAEAPPTEVESPAPVAVEIAQPTGTPEPTRERPHRSYPAPTGYPGFRLYYQKRCYPGCHYDTPPTAPVEVAEAQVDRPHRSYPAPTGYPGFRKYYQKRCYPGCHYDSATPVPTKIHP